MTHFNEEMNEIRSTGFKLGEYIYMGMAKIKGQTVCISVGYKIDYCYNKAMQFQELCSDVFFYKINKVKVGELEKCKEFLITKK